MATYKNIIEKSFFKEIEVFLGSLVAISVNEDKSHFYDDFDILISKITHIEKEKYFSSVKDNNPFHRIKLDLLKIKTFLKKGEKLNNKIKNKITSL